MAYLRSGFAPRFAPPFGPPDGTADYADAVGDSLTVILGDSDAFERTKVSFGARDVDAVTLPGIDGARPTARAGPKRCGRPQPFLGPPPFL